MVSFLPLDISDEDSLQDALAQIDATIQYGAQSCRSAHFDAILTWLASGCAVIEPHLQLFAGEDADVKTREFDNEPPDDIG